MANKTPKPTVRNIRAMSDEAIRFNILDLRMAIGYQEESGRLGYPAPKLGQYWDELFEYAAEAKRRGIVC